MYHVVLNGIWFLSNICEYIFENGIQCEDEEQASITRKMK